MAKEINVPFDFNNIACVNFRQENIASNPSFTVNEIGRSIFNTTYNKPYINDGVEISQIARKKEFTLTGDGSTVTFTLTHNLNTQNCVIECRRGSDNRSMVPNMITFNSTSQVQVRPTSGAPGVGVLYYITVIG